MEKNVTIVGAGLAGSEAALVLSDYAINQNLDINIKLIEKRPLHQTLVHKSGLFAELVCSNSFKSLKENSAAGMLKYELCALGSPIINHAFNNRVEAGKALAVDRIKFAEDVSKEVRSRQNIKVLIEDFENIIVEAKNCDALILATGPLTSNKLSKKLSKITGQDNLAFFDAAAPIILADGIDRNIVFEQDRYGEASQGDYLNAPMTKKEYELFIKNLLEARCIVKKEFEKKELFQACQPIEEIARAGFDAPRFGPMKPVGLIDPRTGKRPYAAVQLRAENKNKTAYNLVGFQTNLTFPDQKFVFSLIPGLFNATIIRYGVMHRNTFLNAPKLLDSQLRLNAQALKDKKIENVYIAGQLGGTEGYLEAVRSGHHAAISAISQIYEKQICRPPNTTVYGSLLDYATCQDTKDYQPMHVNFGIIEPLDKKVKGKQDRYMHYAKRGKIDFDKYIKTLIDVGIKSDEDFKFAEKLKDQIEDIWLKM